MPDLSQNGRLALPGRDCTVFEKNGSKSCKNYETFAASLKNMQMSITVVILEFGVLNSLECRHYVTLLPLKH